jgi:hypothetical protein
MKSAKTGVLVVASVCGEEEKEQGRTGREITLYQVHSLLTKALPLRKLHSGQGCWGIIDGCPKVEPWPRGWRMHLD